MIRNCAGIKLAIWDVAGNCKQKLNVCRTNVFPT
uniref:Uncharacterized protein n=1 Tax=Arundo donax TaxID=35708 RepID=A0A0A9HAS5_ARUDO